VQFRTASNKALKLTAEMRQRAAMLMADLEAVQEGSNPPDKIQLMKCESEHISQSVQFCSASNKTIEVTKQMQKAAEKLLADIEVGNSEMPSKSNNRKIMAIAKDDNETKASTPNKDTKRIRKNNFLSSEDGNNIITLMPSENDNKTIENPVNKNTLIPCEDDHKNTVPRKPFLSEATPQPPKLAVQCSLAFETPKCTPELQVSLTQLTEVSPLDKATKSSIITRRNLLSLNKRRKFKKDAENVATSETPMRQRFTRNATATSTPLPSRQVQRQQPQEEIQSIEKDRRYSQDSPRVQRQRVGKRRSEEALSPIYAPTNKTRRIGLSRVRNKSSNNI
ncbi:hypothetical protein KR044_009571, partial [Drosophila immigrans]